MKKSQLVSIIKEEISKVLKEYTANNFKMKTATSGYGPKINASVFKKLMPKSAASMSEAEDHLSKFEGGRMFVHSLTTYVQPIKGDGEKPTYYLGQSQYYLNSEKVNVTFVLIKDVTDPQNEKKLGWAFVDTDIFLNECRALFDEVKKPS